MSNYSRLESETCLDPKRCFDAVVNDGECFVSKIDGDSGEVGKKESALNRAFQYASRLVA